MLDKKDQTLLEQKLDVFTNVISGKKILITGGTGFFGKWLLEGLNKINANFQITIISRNPDKFIYNYKSLCIGNIRFLKGDLDDFEFPDEIFDYIIYAASDVADRDGRINVKINTKQLEGKLSRIVDIANKNPKCRFLFTSSGSIYESTDGQGGYKFEEKSQKIELENKNSYAVEKLMTENYFLNNLKTEVVIARCFTFAGPYQSLTGGYAFTSFMKNALENSNINLNSSGESIRSYMYAADLTVWLLCILFNGRDRNCYNVGSDEPITLYDLAKLISSDKLSVDINSNETYKNCYIPNVDKAKNELGLELYTKLDDIIKRTMDYYCSCHKGIRG